MSGYQSLLVGVDFTPCSAVAVRQALRLAAGFHAAVRALHVIDTLVAVELEEALSEFQRDVRRGLVTDAREEWARFAAGIPGAADLAFDATINSRLVEVVRRARDCRADLLVLGAYGRVRPNVGVGTLATACVRSAPCDVLLVRDTQPDQMTKIVAAVDFSDTSARALHRAADLAALDQAELHVLHVFDPPWKRLHYRAPTVEVEPHFVKQYGEALARRLKAFARPVLTDHPSLSTRCELYDQPDHRNGIVAYANHIGADLIVLGTRGHTNIRDVFLGTTAEKTLRATSCSVLAVKPAARAED